MNALLEKPQLPTFLHGEVEASDQRFNIDDEQKAAWACSRILAARRRIDRRKELAQAYQSRILDWLDQANAPDQQSADFLESLLRPWVETVTAQSGKSRSILLPGAKVGLRKRPDRVEILNLELVLGFCEEHGLDKAVVVKKEVSKTELKKHLVEGAVIPGAELVTGGDELAVSGD